MAKIYAICSGGDWYDASVYFFHLPEGMIIDDEYRQYCKWYRSLPRTKMGIEGYKSFEDWLKDKGATEPSENDLEQYWAL